MIINVEKANKAIALNDGIMECIPDGYTAEIIKHDDVNITEVLISGEYTISEISYMTGFSSVAYFRQCFKNEYGVSPSGYVKQKQ